jgi:hypothetical protein
MSAPTATQPRTTAGVTTLVAVLGMAALTAHELAAGLGAAAGAVFATAVVTASSGDRYVLPAAVLSGSVLGGLAVLGGAGTPRIVVILLSSAAAVVGIGTATTHLDVSVEGTEILERIAFQGLLATLCGLMLLIAVIGARETMIGVLFAEPSSDTLLALIAVAGIVSTVVVATMPPALFPFTDNRNGERVRTIQQQTSTLLFVSTVLVTVLLGVVNSFVSLPDLLVESSLLHLALLTYSGAGLTLLGIAWYTRWTWHDPSTELDAAFLLGAGSVSGVLIVVAAVVGVGDGSTTELLQLFFLAVPIFGACWFFLNRFRKKVESGTPPTPATVTALGLCSSGVVVATTIPSNEPTGTGIAGLAAVGALAAGLFVYQAGLVGRRFGSEVGSDGASQRTQLVRIGWVGGVTGAGLVLTITTIWFTTVFAPTLSVPATASTFAGCIALFAGVWLLLR